MANWTPDGFIGALFKTLGMHVPPPQGVQSPARWGDRDWIGEQFGDSAASIDFAPRSFVFRYRSPQHFVDYFRTYYGPMHKAFLALDESGQKALQADLLELVQQFNTATDGSMRVPSVYAQIVIARA